MKLWFFLLFFLPTWVSAELLIRDGKVTARLNSEPIQEIVNKLRAEAGIHFSLQDGVEGTSISANFQDLPVALAIKKLLEGTALNHVVIEQNGEAQIFIGTSVKPGVPPKKLDQRPVTNVNQRVVEPVTPPPPTPIAPENRQGQRQRGSERTKDQPQLPPTGGGFGASTPPVQPQNLPANIPQTNLEDLELNQDDEE